MKKEVKTYNGYAMRKSVFAINESPVIVSDNMTAKMSGIPCISTSTALNPICRKRAEDVNSICHHCYAAAVENRYNALHTNLESNYNLLTSEVLPLDVLPVFANVAIARFEAFGDLANETQVINYFNICRVNPFVNFALWTKNPGFIKKAIEDGNEKPENLQIIASSPIVNKVANFDRYDFIDKVFTVYDAETIEKENININCGARCCATCRKCYMKNDIRQISEKLK